MAKSKSQFRVEARGDEWAAVSPEGESLGTFGSQRQAEEYAAAYSEVFNILAQDTGQSVRFGTQKPENADEKRERIKQQAADAARQFAQANENLRDPTFAAPRNAPGALTNAPKATAESELVKQAGASPPALPVGEGRGEGLTADDVRRIVQQEQKRGGKRRTLAEAAKTQAGPIPPAPKSLVKPPRKKTPRKPRRSTGGGRVPTPSSEMVAGGFVLEDPGTNLTAFDVSRMLSGQPAAPTPGVSSTLDYPGAGQGPLAKAAATTGAAPALSQPVPTNAPRAAEGLPPTQAAAISRNPAPSTLHGPPGALAEAIGAGLTSHGIPDVATPPTNAPQAAGSQKPPRPPRRPRGTAGAAPGPAPQPGKQADQGQKRDDYRRLADAIAIPRGKQISEAVSKLLTGMASIFRDTTKTQQQTDDHGRPGQRERADEQRKRRSDRETRTSNRLLARSQQQLKGLFKPLGNAIENFRNVGRAKANEAVVNLAKKLGLDKLGKQFERESRGFAANAARGGLGSAAARAFGQGAVGRVGFNLAGRAAGAAAAGDAGGAAAGAGAAEGGLMAGAGVALANPAGLIAAVGLAAVGTGAALVGLTRRVQHTGEALLENQRDLAKYNAGIAVTFAEFERGRFLRDVQRANQTSASTNLLGQSNTLLQNTTQPFAVTATNLKNIIAAGTLAAVAAALELSGFKQAADGMAKLSDQLARAMGGQAGPPGNPALRFLDDVAKGKFKSPPPPKNKAPKRPGQP